MNQCQRIVNYISKFGSITPFQAFADLGITKLATRVSEMKKKGIVFEQELITTKNRYGESCQFMKYSLSKEELNKIAKMQEHI